MRIRGGQTPRDKPRASAPPDPLPDDGGPSNKTQIFELFFVSKSFTSLGTFEEKRPTLSENGTPMKIMNSYDVCICYQRFFF